jgi:hypothetical protein
LSENFNVVVAKARLQPVLRLSGSFVRTVLRVLLATTVLATAAHAAPQYSRAELCRILTPCDPPRQYASRPFVAPVIIREVTFREIQALCGNGYAAFFGAHRGPDIMGCAELGSEVCIVHLPRDVKTAVPELFEMVRRHELAHCRGWIHDEVVW